MDNLLYHNQRSVFYLVNNDERVKISEPAGWDGTRISVELATDTNTYRVAFTDKEITLRFAEASGFSYLLNINKTQGPDAIVLFRYGILTNDITFDQLYEGRIVMPMWDDGKQKGGSRAANLKIERNSTADLFLSRYTSKTIIESLKTFSGAPLTPLSQVLLRLHQDGIINSAAFNYNTKVLKEEDVDICGAGQGPGFSLFPLTQDIFPIPWTYRSTVPPLIIKTNSIPNLDSPLFPDGQLLYSGLHLPTGVSQIKLDFSWKFLARFVFVNDFEYVGFKIFKKSGIVQPGNDADMNGIITGQIGNEILASTIPLVLDPIAGYYTRTGVFEGSGSIILHDDEALFIRVYVYTNDVKGPSCGSGNSSFIADYPNQSEDFLCITSTIDYAPTLTPTYTLEDSIRRQVEIITDNKIAFRSNLFNRLTGCAGKRLLMNGKMIRGYQGISDSTLCGLTVSGDKAGQMAFSAQDWLKALDALFNIGVNVERDDDGNETLVVEDVAYFFRDVELIDLGTNISKYRKYSEEARIYNQLEFGYSKFPQGQAGQQSNTLDEWMSKMNYQTPVKNNNSKYSQVCDWLLSTFFINLTRQQAFAEDKTKSYETDNDIFMINDTGVEVSSYQTSDNRFLSPTGGGTGHNEIFITDSENTGIAVGDVITISGSSLNNGNLTVTNIREIDGTTLLTILESVQDETGALVTFSFAPRVEAKRSEDFVTVTGIQQPEKAFNLIHHIRRMVLAHAKTFRSGLIQKADNEQIFYTSGGNNSSLKTELDPGITCRFGDNIPSGQKVSDGAIDTEAALQYMDQPLHTQYAIEVSSVLNWPLIKDLMAAFEGRHPDDLDYGYVKLTNPEGEIEKGHVLSMKYNPNTLQVDFKLREKYL